MLAHAGITMSFDFVVAARKARFRAAPEEDRRRACSRAANTRRMRIEFWLNAKVNSIG
jgi:hypothetical protein